MWGSSHLVGPCGTEGELVYVIEDVTLYRRNGFNVVRGVLTLLVSRFPRFSLPSFKTIPWNWILNV